MLLKAFAKALAHARPWTRWASAVPIGAVRNALGLAGSFGDETVQRSSAGGARLLRPA